MEWGPAFWKTNPYAPFPIWLWLNGHEWAKQQMEKAGIACEALHNGFLSCSDPGVLQKRCDQLGTGAPEDIARRSLLAIAWRALDRALDGFVERSLVAA